MIYTIYHIDGHISRIFKGEASENKSEPTANETQLEMELTEEDYQNALSTWIIKDGVLVPNDIQTIAAPKLKTFTWVNPEGIDRKLSYTKMDQDNTVKLKVWFDMGGFARDWKFENDEVVKNVDADKFQSIVKAAMAQMAP